jgi:hypothetical protein
MYEGYANEDSYLWDVMWSNDQTLYEAIKSEGRRLLEWLPGMTDQTLGVNLLNSIKAAMCDGGWGWRSCPDNFTHIPQVTWDIVSGTLNIGNVNEEEFGAAVREALDLP